MAFNPQITPQYGITLPAMGMMNQAAGNLGRGVAEAVEKRQQEHKAYKALVQYADASGMLPKDQAELMSKDELEGRLRGMVYQQEQRRRTEQDAMDLQYKGSIINENMAQAQAYNAKARMDQDAQQREAGAARTFGQYFSTPKVPMQNPPQLNEATLAQLVAEQPGIVNTDFFKNLKGAVPSMQAGQGAITLPDGEVVTTFNGQLVRQRPPVREPQPGVTFSRDPLTGDLRESYTGPLSAVERLRAAAMSGKPQEESSNPPVEAPRDAGQRTKGTVYQTPRGPLRWTGTGWVTP